MIYGSVCSGIEAASVAWRDLGWTPAWFSEILPFPSAVLKHHYPMVENMGDMSKIYEKETFKKSKIGLLVGGTPCQSFSLAGNRGGLDDPRGDLALEFLRIAQIKKPKWIMWENVVGVLSSGKGEHFGSFIGKMAEIGYCCAWRVLDASYSGIPQRRRRVFLVGYLGDWRPAAAVLFGSEDLCWDFKESERKGGENTSKIQESLGEDDRPIGVDVYNYKVTGDVAATMGANCGSKNSHGPKVLDSRGIRLHTPIECERLQGFPDGYTNIPYGVKNLDNCRYAALGNSMPVPLMRWIGKRIDAFENIGVGK